MAWYYHLNGENQGPIETAELQGLFQSSAIASDTLVWTEGMAQWEPYQNSSAAGSSAVTETCAECHRSFPQDEMLHYENSWVCPACKPVFFQRVKEGVTPRGEFKLATIGNRFLAALIDGFVIWIAVVILLVPVFIPYFMGFAAAMKASPNHVPAMSLAMRLYLYLVEYGLPAGYEIFLIGRYGATWGKMLMKIKVVSPEGNPISYGRATGRHFAKALSGIILGIGYLMAFWDDEKRALHDRICNTRVITNTNA